jgi:hypothetical protein
MKTPAYRAAWRRFAAWRQFSKSERGGRIFARLERTQWAAHIYFDTVRSAFEAGWNAREKEAVAEYERNRIPKKGSK